MANSSFSGRVRIEVRDVLRDKIVYAFEGDNKIIGANLYGRDTSLLTMVYLGKGFVEEKDCPRKPDGTPEAGWYKADGVFYFKKEPAGDSSLGYTSFAEQKIGNPSAVLIQSPIRKWEITTKGYQFKVGAFNGVSLDCVFITGVNNNTDWSVINIPAFVPTASSQITVWYTLSFYPDTSEGELYLNLSGTTHRVTYKPARWNESPIAVFGNTQIKLGADIPRMWHYTNVTSLGGNDAAPNGENYNCNMVYKDMPFEAYVDGSMQRKATLTFGINDMNCAPNGISGLVIRSGMPYQYTQMKIDPPIMKTTDMRLTLDWLYSWGVVNEQVE